jgi:hypothetical protein
MEKGLTVEEDFPLELDPPELPSPSLCLEGVFGSGLDEPGGDSFQGLATGSENDQALV